VPHLTHSYKSPNPTLIGLKSIQRVIRCSGKDIQTTRHKGPKPWSNRLNRTLINRPGLILHHNLTNNLPAHSIRSNKQARPARIRTLHRRRDGWHNVLGIKLPIRLREDVNADGQAGGLQVQVNLTVF